MKALRVLLLAAVAASAFAGSALAAEPPLESKIADLIAPGRCTDASVDPLAEARTRIDAFRKEKKTKKVLEKTFRTWLAEEQGTGKDVSALNWIRALDPNLLPSDFPARKAYIRCSAELRTLSDFRKRKTPDAAAATETVADWRNCVRVTYVSSTPAEFTALAKCLGAKDLAPDAED